MRLLKARIIGFQSFGDSGDMEFADGINLLVGQNNAGKSAVLRALQPTLPDDRHRTPDRWEDFRLPEPQVGLTIDISGSEFRYALLQSGTAHVPVPPGAETEQYMTNLLSKTHILVDVTRRSSSNFAANYPGHGEFSSQGTGSQQCALVRQRGGELYFEERYQGDDNTADVVLEMWRRNMFYFSAERMLVGQSGTSHAPRLDPNAQNLPAVLLTLSGDRGNVFHKLVRHVREILPTVGNVSVRPLPNNNNIEVRVWPTESMERFELSFPLLQSGTGVAQVLAILTAVMTVEDAVILIDEINSFLHPAAVKSLLRILQSEYSRHQYIISTHSPDVISFSNPSTIHIVKRTGYNSVVNKINLADVDTFREVAEHLGVSMADVFAADRVIWVEGPTEELCFPLLFQWETGEVLPRGTIFTSVLATGDFLAKRRDKQLVYQVYQRLSQAAVPLVVSAAFSFDSENLTDKEKEDMVRDAQGAVHFLPRRHIECYLINPRAIAEFLSERDHTARAISATAVATKLADLAAGEFKIPEWNGDIWNPAWLARVDAANLIAQACAQLSEQRVTFNKKNDTLALLKGVKADAPGQVAELCRYVEGLVNAAA